MEEERREKPTRSHDLNELFGMMRDFGNRLDVLADKLEKHMDEEAEVGKEYTAAINKLASRVGTLAVKVEEVSALHKAFPPDEDGKPDIRGHRRYHDSLIEEDGERGKFWRGIKHKVGEYLVFAALMVFCFGINSYIQRVAAGENVQLLHVEPGK